MVQNPNAETMETKNKTIHAILNLSWGGKTAAELNSKFSFYFSYNFLFFLMIFFFPDEYKNFTGVSVTSSKRELEVLLSDMKHVHKVDDAYVSTSSNSRLYQRM